MLVMSSTRTCARNGCAATRIAALTARAIRWRAGSRGSGSVSQYTRAAPRELDVERLGERVAGDEQRPELREPPGPLAERGGIEGLLGDRWGPGCAGRRGVDPGRRRLEGARSAGELLVRRQPRGGAADG